VRERLVKALEPVLRGLGLCLALSSGEHAEPLAGGALHPSLAHADEEDVPGDAEEPRAGRTASLVAEATAAEPGLRERLGREIERGVRVPAPARVVGVDALGLAVVELAERARIRARRYEQVGVAPHSRSLTVGTVLSVRR
jgi:hypothetical protein